MNELKAAPALRRIVDMLPEFLLKRARAFGPDREALAEQVGLPANVMMLMATGTMFAEGDVVRRERLVWRSPYASKWPASEAAWASAVEAGAAEAREDGWRMLPRALAAAETVLRGFRLYLSRLPLPADTVRRAADTLEPIARRIPSEARRAALPRRHRPGQDEPAYDTVRLNSAIYELWYFRDDCHIGAWQDAGYEGPIFDVLSHLWSGRPDMSITKLPGATSVDALATALEQRQDRAEVERALGMLASRGDVEREGDSVRLSAKGLANREAIEDETDRRFFAIWELDQKAASRLEADLRAVIDALPEAAS